MFVKDVVVLVNSIVLYWPGVMMSWYGEERRGDLNWSRAGLAAAS